MGTGNGRVGIRQVVYQDPEGRRFLRGVPSNVPDGEAGRGIPLGPPPLDELNLPLDLEVRLHNQLFDRKLFTEKDAKHRLMEIVAALQAVYLVDARRVLAIYQGRGVLNADGEKPAKGISVAGLDDRGSRGSKPRAGV